MDKAFEKNAGMRTMFHNWLLLHRSTNAEGELWESSEWRQKGAVVMLRAWAHARAEDMLTQYNHEDLATNIKKYVYDPLVNFGEQTLALEQYMHTLEGLVRKANNLPRTAESKDSH